MLSVVCDIGSDKPSHERNFCRNEFTVSAVSLLVCCKICNKLSL